MANAVKAAGDKAQYDVYVKRLLSQKLILANILVRTIDEFKGMQPEDAVYYIEGEPKVGVVPVEPGLTNEEKADGAVQAQTGRTDTAGLTKARKPGEIGQRIIGLMNGRVI